jgi:cell wall-associated NlpC family hydrolase
VASQRLKRAMRGALAAGVVVAAVTFNATGATADPGTSSGGSDPMSNYDQLSQQADTLNEQLNTANTELVQKQDEQRQANADLAAAQAQERTAQAQEDQFRASVDNLTVASFEGARMDQLSALLTGSSARDYLDRATDLQNLASDNYAVLAKYQAAVDQAAAAATKAQNAAAQAQDAINAAQALLGQIQQQSAQLNQQLAQVSQAMSQLSAADRKQLSDIGPNLVVVPPPGVSGRAVMYALSMRGKPYVWGAAGPGSFDCSGLVIWAYGKAGVSGLPHSSQVLSTMGTAVSRADLQIGDLVFFGSPVHHVGIYVGNGYMVDAPETGEVVKIQPIWPTGYEGARRLNY